MQLGKMYGLSHWYTDNTLSFSNAAAGRFNLEQLRSWLLVVEVSAEFILTSSFVAAFCLRLSLGLQGS
jgi:hypothetical protein